MAELEFNKNDDKMRLLISEMRRRHAEVSLGGGKKKIEKQHVKGKLTARERIDYLKDKDAEFLEIAAFAGYDMYPEYGGCPSGGVVAGFIFVINLFDLPGSDLLKKKGYKTESLIEFPGH